jgi:Acetyltransferase (GNAT) domain
MSKLAYDSSSTYLQNLIENQKNTIRDVSVFLSPWWLSHYIKLWSDKSRYLQSSDPLCIFGQEVFRSRLGIQYRRIALNQSLESSLESLTLEVNGFANTPDPTAEALLPVLLAQLKAETSWDELRFSAINEVMVKALFDWAKVNQLIAYEYASSETFWVDFSALNHQASEPFLSSRSANCRQQLRKSRRQIEERFGVLKIENASSADTAYDWLDSLGYFHRLRWPSNNPLEGFHNPLFIQFFKQIIQDGLLEGKVQLLKISAGEKPVGYLFNLVKDGRVSFLMSGIDYYETEKYKPGMLCHWLAIEKNFSEGMRVYDFLAGTNRYKESLSTHREAVKTITLARPRLGLWFEHLIRRQRRSGCYGV